MKKTRRRKTSSIAIGLTVLLVGGEYSDLDTDMVITEKCTLQNLKFFTCTSQEPSMKDSGLYPILFLIPKDVCL